MRVRRTHVRMRRCIKREWEGILAQSCSELALWSRSGASWWEAWVTSRHGLSDARRHEPTWWCRRFVRCSAVCVRFPLVSSCTWITKTESVIFLVKQQMFTLCFCTIARSIVGNAWKGWKCACHAANPMIDYVPGHGKGISMSVKSKNTLLLGYSTHWCIIMQFPDAKQYLHH